MVQTLLIAVFLMMKPTYTEALGDMSLCYILDGILIVYGIVLTILYSRLRFRAASKAPASQPENQYSERGIYAGLASQSSDTYETIKMDKKPYVC